MRLVVDILNILILCFVVFIYGVAYGKIRFGRLQSAQRKSGRWIDNHTTCSECGWQMIDDVMQTPNMVGFNYCPNCGADMREGEQDGINNMSTS